MKFGLTGVIVGALRSQVLMIGSLRIFIGIDIDGPVIIYITDKT